MNCLVVNCLVVNCPIVKLIGGELYRSGEHSGVAGDEVSSGELSDGKAVR